MDVNAFVDMCIRQAECRQAYIREQTEDLEAEYAELTISILLWHMYWTGSFGHECANCPGLHIA